MARMSNFKRKGTTRKGYKSARLRHGLRGGKHRGRMRK